MGKGAGELTRKQELFCQEYIVDYNGTKAAIRAGYEERSARQMARGSSRNRASSPRIWPMIRPIMR